MTAAISALHLGGVLHIGLAVFHLLFWRIFRWREDLAKLTFVNRQIMQVLNLCAVYVFLVVAFLSLMDTEWLYRNMLLSFFIAGFWTLRALLQLVFFGVRQRASTGLFFVFLFMASLYGYAWFHSRTH